MSAPAFDVNVAREAHAPPEARGLDRDEVRLMVASRDDGSITHARFRDLPRFLAPGDLLVNNASLLGPSPQPGLAEYPLGVLETVYRVNVLAPLALTQLVLPRMPAGGVIVNITSDAAVEPYEGWGGYGSSKAALEQLTAILGDEHPEHRIYAVDPGDMNTQMHQEAFPGEDISDRPPPEDSVPGLLALIGGNRPSGRYRAHDLAGVGA